jgi:hypothetical protein
MEEEEIQIPLPPAQNAFLTLDSKTPVRLRRGNAEYFEGKWGMLRRKEELNCGGGVPKQVFWCDSAVHSLSNGVVKILCRLFYSDPKVMEHLSMHLRWGDEIIQLDYWEKFGLGCHNKTGESIRHRLQGSLKKGRQEIFGFRFSSHFRRLGKSGGSSSGEYKKLGLYLSQFCFGNLEELLNLIPLPSLRFTFGNALKKLKGISYPHWNPSIHWEFPYAFRAQVYSALLVFKRFNIPKDVVAVHLLPLLDQRTIY